MCIKDRMSYEQYGPKSLKAQAKEKEQFQALLFDLCKTISEPPSNGVQRQRTRTSDAIFACALKIYSTLPPRRFATDLIEAHKKGYVGKLIGHNRVCKYLHNEMYTPILKELIVQSSLPLVSVETDFAVDSTGFSTPHSLRWFDDNGERKRQEWVKVHVMLGVKTNIITAVEITMRHVPDCPFFGLLTRTTAKNFQVKAIYADKAYLSQLTFQAAVAVGAVPYIPFKMKARPCGSDLWDKLYHYYRLHQDEFYQHYRKRQNAESAFAAIKRRFGHRIGSLSDTAMVNEALCKILCYNITCLISSMRKVDIDPDVRKDNGKADTAIQPIAPVEM